MINVAIIGTGNIAPAHISAYLRFADRCRIVALCDIYPKKAEEKRNGYSLDGAKVYGDHEQMLQDTTLNIDLVSICTPPYTHAEIAVNCMRAGKHVIIEKPWPLRLRSVTASARRKPRPGSSSHPLLRTASCMM